jgi:outer membrane immunogenic protein
MRWNWATAVAVALLTTGVQAEELSRKAPFAWSGWYIGAHAGYGWGKNQWKDFIDPVNPLNVVPGPDADYSLNGALVGGQVGYNWQVSGGVLGIEADASWADLEGAGGNSPAFFGGCLQQMKCNTDIEALGTITGRMGLVVDRALLYAKGGIAWAYDQHATGYKHDPDPSVTYWDDPAQMRWGWTVGAGVEYLLGAGWSTKLEYNYIDLADERVTFDYAPQTFGGRATSEEVLHTVKLGLNYRFGN